MSRKPLSIAVAGAGLIGRKHCELIGLSDDCRLAAIVDPSPEARDYAVSHQTPYFATLDDLLSRAKPDGVVLATPNRLHVSGAIACLERGVPVLIEKPVSDDLESARALIAVEEKARVPALVGHHRRHNPIVQAARRAVRDGLIGDLTTAVSLWLLKKPDDYFDVAWRREAGGGPILINLIHDIDNLRFICGDIVEVGAQLSSKARGFPVEDTMAATFRFANGAVGTATVSDATPAPWSWEISSGENAIYPKQDENCYLFSGTKGSLALPRMDLWSYAGKPSWWEPLTRSILDASRADPLVAQLAHFAAVIRGEQEPIITAADAAGTLAVIEAIRRSATTKAQAAVETIVAGRPAS